MQQVSNHVAAMDDPFVISSLLPPSVMLNANNIRWTLCASDRCFSNPMFSAFFRCVKVLPVSRGDGIYQKVLIIIIYPSVTFSHLYYEAAYTVVNKHRNFASVI